jgi:hypothetical protein
VTGTFFDLLGVSISNVLVQKKWNQATYHYQILINGETVSLRYIQCVICAMSHRTESRKSG